MLFNACLDRISAFLVSATAFLTWTAAAAEPNLSAYLSAKAAVSNGDYAQAAKYFEEAIESDPGDVDLLASAFPIYVIAGEFEQAISAARNLNEIEFPYPLVSLALVVDEVSAGNFEAALEIHDAAPFENLFLADLLRGWLHLGAGDADAALELFSRELDAEFLTNVINLHRGLAHSALGDLGSAAETFAGIDVVLATISDGYLIQYANILAQQGDLEAAERLLSESSDNATQLGKEIIAAHLEELGEPGSFARDRNYAPKDGIAEVLSMFARLLATEDRVDFTQPALFMRFVEMVDRGNSAAKFRIAEYLENAGSYALAAEIFDGIAEDDPLRLSAEIGRAEALHSDGDIENAIASLRMLASEFPNSERVAVALGKILHDESRFEEAIDAYDDAIAISPDRTVENSLTYFFRGMSLERAERWEEAKIDLNVARELSEGLPAHPYILNYLGYSMLIEGDDPAEAEEMIRIAVEAHPDNGAFVDSLGWALYMLGRYDEALVELEKALKLEPTEPEIIEHLGDAYWQVGRRREAEFQWRRALTFDPADEYRIRIERKLEIGLDAFLAETAESSDETTAD